MSLIADALRKVGTPSPVSPPPARPKFRWAAGALLIGGVGLTLTVWAHPPAVRRPAAAQPPPRLAFAQKRGQTPPKPILASSLLRTVENQWRLNGIVRGAQGGPVALINNQLVEEGQTIQGIKLVRVSQDQVDLEADGEVKTLKLR